MLTEEDIKYLEGTFITEEKFDRKIQSFKSDLIDKLDKILKEILTSREEQTILIHKVTDHEERITGLETATA